jgi:hypothetical protein
VCNDHDDPKCIVFNPPLLALLYKAEQTMGVPLTEAQVLAVRDHATYVVLPYSVAAAGEKARGYPDIVAENCWAEWQAVRKRLFEQGS